MITICGKEYSTDITELDLANKELTKIPEEIKYLINLKSLNLCENKITAIPEHIFDSLINLRELYLFENQITAIPEHLFDSLINLHTLNLSVNKITAVPEHLFDNMTNLITLYIHDNQITAIPEHLFDILTNLKRLVLSRNKITDIPEHLFASLTNLERLGLSSNQITTIPVHIDRLTNLVYLDLSFNQITEIPISILNCRHLRYFYGYGNPIERTDIRIQRFFSNSQNVHSSSIQSSVKESINSLMRDPFTMDKEDIIKQLIEESPVCLQSLLCYLDDKDIHSTLYLTFFEVFEKVWGRIIGSDFKADLIKRLDEEMMDSECKCFTYRMSRLVNVLVGFFNDITISTSNSERICANVSSDLDVRKMSDEKIGDIISSVLNSREMTDELREICRKSLKDAEIEDDEIGKWLDIKIWL